MLSPGRQVKGATCQLACLLKWNFRQIAEASSRRGNTPVPHCHVDSWWQVYLSYSRSVFFRCPRWNARWNVESRVLRYVLVLACSWPPLRGRGMCGIQLNMLVWGLRHKVTWVVSGDTLVWRDGSSDYCVVLICNRNYFTSHQEVRSWIAAWQASPAVKCCLMVMQNGRSFDKFEGETSVIYIRNLMWFSWFPVLFLLYLSPKHAIVLCQSICVVTAFR